MWARSIRVKMLRAHRPEGGDLGLDLVLDLAGVDAFQDTLERGCEVLTSASWVTISATALAISWSAPAGMRGRSPGDE